KDYTPTRRFQPLEGSLAITCNRRTYSKVLGSSFACDSIDKVGRLLASNDRSVERSCSPPGLVGIPEVESGRWSTYEQLPVARNPTTNAKSYALSRAQAPAASRPARS